MDKGLKLKGTFKKTDFIIPPGFKWDNDLITDDEGNILTKIFIVKERVINEEGYQEGIILKFINEKEIYVPIEKLNKKQLNLLFNQNSIPIDESTISKILRYITLFQLVNEKDISEKRQTPKGEELIDKLNSFVEQNMANFFNPSLSSSNPRVFYGKINVKEKKDNKGIVYLTEIYLTNEGIEKFAEYLSMPQKELLKLLVSYGILEKGKDRIAKRTNISLGEVVVKAYKIIVRG